MTAQFLHQIGNNLRGLDHAIMQLINRLQLFQQYPTSMYSKSTLQIIIGSAVTISQSILALKNRTLKSYGINILRAIYMEIMGQIYYCAHKMEYSTWQLSQYATYAYCYW